MKNLKFLLAICLLPFMSLAQDTVYVSQNKTTTIQFPSEIVTPISENAVDVQVKHGNLLLLKASDKQFQFASLTVNTKKGDVYKVPIAFSYGRAGRVNKIDTSNVKELVKIPKVNPLRTTSEQIVNTHKFKKIASDKDGKMAVELGEVTIVSDQLFFRLKIKNKSNINFDIDFIRFYVRDLKTAKRTVTQEQEITPKYSHGIENESVGGNTTHQYVFALDKFPMAKDKALYVEVYEKNGGRNLYLKVKQSEIEDGKLMN